MTAQVWRERVGGRVHVAEVGGPVGCLRRSDAEKMDIAEGPRFGERIREPEAASLEVLAQQRLETRLKERSLALGGHGHLVLIHVEREDVVAEVRHADGVREAEVTGADHGQPHAGVRRAHVGLRVGQVGRVLAGPGSDAGRDQADDVQATLEKPARAAVTTLLQPTTVPSRRLCT
jgi:hypothetical protein